MNHKTYIFKVFSGFPGGSGHKESACNARDLGLIPGLGRFPRRRNWQPTPVFLPGKSHGWRSLVSCSPWGHWKSDMTERLHFHALEKEMATHSSVLAWRTPGTEEPGGLQSMGSLRVGHDWATSLSRTGEGHGNSLQSSFLENPRDRGAWWAAVYGVTQSRTRLKRLRSSSSIYNI